MESEWEKPIDKRRSQFCRQLDREIDNGRTKNENEA